MRISDWSSDVCSSDLLGSAILDFPGVQASFVYSTQLVPSQRMHFFGTDGRVEIEIPFNAPPDRPCRVFVERRDRIAADAVECLELPTCDQYAVAGDAFVEALRNGTPQPIDRKSTRLNYRH